VVRSEGMQWAAVSTKLALRRVPPQRPPYMTSTCHGFEWAGFSTVPPTMRPDSEHLKKIDLQNPVLKKSCLRTGKAWPKLGRLVITNFLHLMYANEPA
jgi:hypothetical protein